jgi:triosephosphate isomerase (TIM)
MHVVANWKMNLTLSQAIDLSRKLVSFMKQDNPGLDLVVCPSYTMLDRVRIVLGDAHIALGAQDVSETHQGSRTGDVSAAMLTDVGCKYVIVGHSERRTNHNETDLIVKKKVEISHAYGLKTIICVGETSEERVHGQTLEIIKDQLTSIVVDDAVVADNVWIAYEPLWSIGTGIVPSVDEINHIAEYCHGIFATRFSFENKVKFLYGGSVSAENCANIMRSDLVDGVLIGGASLNFEEFKKILLEAKSICKHSL